MEDHDNEYIVIPIRLEQCILEGSYKQVMDINSKYDKNYKYYLHKFDGAIRFQIARSAEKSYESLKIVDAANLMRFNNADELINYIKTEVETIEVRSPIKHI
jgi:26S proteasome regulatory subunit N12